MRQPELTTITPRGTCKRRAQRRSLGQVLVENGVLAPGDLAKAQALMLREDARLEDILLHNLMVGEAELYGAMCRQHGVRLADLVATPPDPRLIDVLGVKRCIAQGLVPWKRIGGATVIATARPDEFERFRATLPGNFGPVLMAVAPLGDIHRALMNARLRLLAEAAETRVAAHESSRRWNRGRLLRAALAGGLIAMALMATDPLMLFAALTLWVVLALCLGMVLKLSAAMVQLRAMRRRGHPFLSRRNRPVIARLPTVSVMVPLFREREIAGLLVRRLQRLNYPRELLDILLVVEEDDTLTRETLARTALPHWMRVIVVPRGRVRTKPRALNYALDFCRGSIIGVYDAEDAPHPDQIHEIVRRFHDRGPEVACLQGILDFYNPGRNWLARCFTIEYASWFRVVLPGISRLGLAIPLGGTTLFFRRKALEALGGWDAHNVTEDADLGIRLARHGYRTEVVPTVTREEANCRPLPWIRQRSRWLKGFAITWAVHMRNPRQSLRDLGWRSFLGMQILFLGTFSQFLLAPLLWSFWVIPLGISHPLAVLLPWPVVASFGTLFLLCEAGTIAIGMLAVSGPAHRHLLPWVPTLHFYYPLATLAAWKALWEILTRPFYWDKTAHGRFSMPGSGIAAQQADDRCHAAASNDHTGAVPEDSGTGHSGKSAKLGSPSRKQRPAQPDQPAAAGPVFRHRGQPGQTSPVPAAPPPRTPDRPPAAHPAAPPAPVPMIRPAAPPVLRPVQDAFRRPSKCAPSGPHRLHRRLPPRSP